MNLPTCSIPFNTELIHSPAIPFCIHPEPPPGQQPELPAQPGLDPPTPQLPAGTAQLPARGEGGPPNLTSWFKLHLENIFSRPNATTNWNSYFFCLWRFIGTDVHYFKHEKKKENHRLGKHQNDSSNKHVTLKLESTLYNKVEVFFIMAK